MFQTWSLWSEPAIVFIWRQSDPNEHELMFLHISALGDFTSICWPCSASHQHVRDVFWNSIKLMPSWFSSGLSPLLVFWASSSAWLYAIFVDQAFSNSIFHSVPKLPYECIANLVLPLSCTSLHASHDLSVRHFCTFWWDLPRHYPHVTQAFPTPSGQCTDAVSNENPPKSSRASAEYSFKCYRHMVSIGCSCIRGCSCSSSSWPKSCSCSCSSCAATITDPYKAIWSGALVLVNLWKMSSEPSPVIGKEGRENPQTGTSSACLLRRPTVTVMIMGRWQKNLWGAGGATRIFMEPIFVCSAIVSRRWNHLHCYRTKLWNMILKVQL